ncbi:MAG: class I SAM-dependent methyltransferase [Archangium sp.]|nr:class I SAM-dependent methyltransferase [Archangium sp.]
MSENLRFDEQYYRRFYVDASTRVYDQKRHAKLIAGVIGLAEWFGVHLNDVLDVGAGLGWWGQWLRTHRKGVNVVSTEMESEICKRYGHVQADIRTFKLDRTFDLVICQGVLPYLDDQGAAAAIENLASMCDGLLYLEAITKDDMKDAIDPSRTDLRVNLRPAKWYRERLAPHFREVGAGVYAAHRAELPFFALEAPPLPRGSKAKVK